jgi:predicted small metal-binding protein
VKGYTEVMKVIDCDCGKTLQAGNDEDLVEQVRAHADEAHPDLELSDEQARQLVADRAYEASDS